MPPYCTDRLRESPQLVVPRTCKQSETNYSPRMAIKPVMNPADVRSVHRAAPSSRLDIRRHKVAPRNVLHKIESFFRRAPEVIVALGAKEILDEQITKQLT
jgi:hypothetical protein